MKREEPAQVWTRKTKVKCGHEIFSSSMDKKDQAQVCTWNIQLKCQQEDPGQVLISKTKIKCGLRISSLSVGK